MDQNRSCQSCQGQKYTQTKRKVKVAFPAGVKTGNQLRLQGMGNKLSKGETRGDAYLEITVS